MSARLADEGVLINAMDPERLRAVTHYGIGARIRGGTAGRSEGDEGTGMSKRGAPAALEPYFLYLILAAVGIGTALLEQSTRLAIVWTVMVLIGLAYRATAASTGASRCWRSAVACWWAWVIGVPLLASCRGSCRLLRADLWHA